MAVSPSQGPQPLREAIDPADRRRMLLSVGAVALVVAVIYASTLMTTISGCSHNYCDDTGELQVALAEWGTVHYTGYPLYMLLGSPFVAVLRWIGVPPAAGASVYSLVWELAAVVGALALLCRLTGQALPAVGAVLALAFTRPIWIHGAIPEVYSIGLALGVGVLWLAYDLARKWNPRRAWLLALAGGTAVAHHRLMVLLLLPVGLALLPVVVRNRPPWRWYGVAVLLCAAGFLPYLDMPFRIWRGATWHYDNPGTWDGFLRVFWGKEVSDLQQAGLSSAALLKAARNLLRFFVVELTWPGLILWGLGVVGALVAATRRSVPAATRRLTWILVGVLACYGGFALLFRRAVLLDAAMMMPLLALTLLLGLAAAALPPGVRTVAGTGLVVIAAALAVRNAGFVVGLTGDRSSVVYAERFDHLDAPAGATIVVPWGARYFALAYAQRVEGRLSPWTIVDHRADIPALMEPAGGVAYTAEDTLYILDGAWWRARLGERLHIVSAGPRLIALSAQPLARAEQPGISIGDGISLVDWAVVTDAPERMRVILTWTCSQAATRDYSTFVHVTDREEIITPEDLLGQSDSASPVYGRYPVPEWEPLELVREDHEVALVPGRTPATIFCGMYSRDAEGRFAKLGQVALVRDAAGEWRLR